MTGWTVQLISPSGNVVSRRQLKDPVSDLSERFVAEVVARHLSNRPIAHGSDVVLADPWRSLFNSEFHSWHKYRVIWGKRNFFDAYEYNPSCSNNCDYSEWDLYLVGNGPEEVILSGCLPGGWWEWTEEDRLQWLADPPSEFVGEDGNTYEY